MSLLVRSSMSMLRPNRLHQQARGSRPTHRSLVVVRAATSENSSGSSSEHPEVQGFDQATADFNAQHLSFLAQRIQALKESQTVHFLEHGYQQSTVEAVVEESLETRPELTDGSFVIFDWHESQWSKLRDNI